MRYSFHPEAREEFRLAIDYYEERETTLGYQFAAEVYAAIERTSAHPEMWPFIEEGIRRSLVRRFPGDMNGDGGVLRVQEAAIFDGDERLR